MRSAAQAAVAFPEPYRHEPDSPTQLEARSLSTLLAIGPVLSGTPTLKSAMDAVLEILARHHGAIRGSVTLLEENGALSAKASYGPDRSERALSVICVPIVWNGNAIGALSLELVFNQDRSCEPAETVLTIVASMLAQAITSQRQLVEDRRRMDAEAARLRSQLREQYDFSNLVGTSGPARRMYEQAAQAAGADTTVLIRGESGDRQGPSCPRDSLQLPAREEALCKRQLRGIAWSAD